jgi:hypothetical protein
VRAVLVGVVAGGVVALGFLAAAFALPLQYFIDRDGVVRGWEFGELPLDQYDPSLVRILASPLPTP